MALILASPIAVGAAPAGQLEVELSNLRSGDGHVRLCLTANPKHFPNCKGDPAAHRLAAPAASERLRFRNLPSGAYALSVIHDENDNAQLDTFARIPREGIGFSRNPVVRFGPPKFDAACFTIGAGEAQQNVRIRYFL